jgi:hypothetical protein
VLILAPERERRRAEAVVRALATFVVSPWTKRGVGVIPWLDGHLSLDRLPGLRIAGVPREHGPLGRAVERCVSIVDLDAGIVFAPDYSAGASSVFGQLAELPQGGGGGGGSVVKSGGGASASSSTLSFSAMSGDYSSSLDDGGDLLNSSPSGRKGSGSKKTARGGADPSLTERLVAPRTTFPSDRAYLAHLHAELHSLAHTAFLLFRLVLLSCAPSTAAAREFGSLPSVAFFDPDAEYCDAPLFGAPASAIPTLWPPEFAGVRSTFCARWGVQEQDEDILLHLATVMMDEMQRAAPGYVEAPPALRLDHRPLVAFRPPTARRSSRGPRRKGTS